MVSHGNTGRHAETRLCLLTFHNFFGKSLFNRKTRNKSTQIATTLVMNLLKLSKPLINLRSYATKRYVPKKPYRSAYTDENLTTKPKLDADTIEILEKLSLVGKLTEKNIKTVEDAIAFADVVLKVDTKRVDPLYTVLEDW